jgi:hypothetical protein
MRKTANQVICNPVANKFAEEPDIISIAYDDDGDSRLAHFG